MDEKIFARESKFVAGVDSLDRLIPPSLPEIAFAGRSNVGKSSLINAICGRRDMARTSQTPGRTQQLNFFDIGGAFHLVDMPGYGYAKVSKEKVRGWNELLKAYMRGRVNLRACFLLVDARHGLKDSDLEMLTWLDDAGVATRVILTKADDAKKSELEATIAAVEKGIKKHPAAFPKATLTSSKQGSGIDEVRQIILTAISG